MTSKFLASSTNIFGCDSGKEIDNVNEPQAIFTIVTGESQQLYLAAQVMWQQIPLVMVIMTKER